MEWKMSTVDILLTTATSLDFGGLKGRFGYV